MGIMFGLIFHQRQSKIIYQQMGYPRFIHKILRKELHLFYYILTGATWMALEDNSNSTNFSRCG